MSSLLHPKNTPVIEAEKKGVSTSQYSKPLNNPGISCKQHRDLVLQSQVKYGHSDFLGHDRVKDASPLYRTRQAALMRKKGSLFDDM